MAVLELFLEDGRDEPVVAEDALVVGGRAAGQQDRNYPVRPQELPQVLQGRHSPQQTHCDHALQAVAPGLLSAARPHRTEGDDLLAGSGSGLETGAVLHELHLGRGQGLEQALEHDYSVVDQLVLDELEDVLLAVVIEHADRAEGRHDGRLNALLGDEDHAARGGVVDQVVVREEGVLAVPEVKHVPEKVLLGVDACEGAGDGQQVLHDEHDALVVVGGAGDDEVGVLHHGLDEVVVGRPHEPHVLGHDAPVGAASFADVPVHASAEPDVVVAGHEDAHLHELPDLGVVQHEDALEQDELGLGQRSPALPPVGLEVVDGNLGRLPVLELPEHDLGEFHVQRVGVVEVVLAGVGALLEVLVEAVEGDGDGPEAALEGHHLCDGAADGGFARGAAACDSDQEAGLDVVADSPGPHQFMMGQEESVQDKFSFDQVLDETVFGQAMIYKDRSVRHSYIVAWHMPESLSLDQQSLLFHQAQALLHAPCPGVSQFLHVREENELSLCGQARTTFFQAFNNFTMRSYIRLAREGQIAILESEVWYVAITLLETYTRLEKDRVPFSYAHLDNLFVNTAGKVKLYPFTPLFPGVKGKSTGMHTGLAQIVLSLMFPEARFVDEPKSSIIQLRHMQSAMEMSEARFSPLLLSFCRELIKQTQFLKDMFCEEMAGKVEVAECLRFINEQQN